MRRRRGRRGGRAAAQGTRGDPPDGLGLLSGDRAGGPRRRAGGRRRARRPRRWIARCRRRLSRPPSGAPGWPRPQGLEVQAEAVHGDGNAWRTLLDTAHAHRAAAVVVGSRGKSAIGAALVGSVSRALVHHAPAPVLVVRPPESAMSSFDHARRRRRLAPHGQRREPDGGELARSGSTEPLDWKRVEATLHEPARRTVPALSPARGRPAGPPAALRGPPRVRHRAAPAPPALCRRLAIGRPFRSS